MKEYMLLIRNIMDNQSDWPEEKHEGFLKACENYIGGLKKEEKLIAAQPMQREGRMISGSAEDWSEGPFREGHEVIVGYYHIRARDMEDAIAIAKQNPEFSYTKTARVEVRPIKSREEETGFEYPRE